MKSYIAGVEEERGFIGANLAKIIFFLLRLSCCKLF